MLLAFFSESLPKSEIACKLKLTPEHNIVEMKGFCFEKLFWKNSLVVVQSKHSVVVAEGDLKIWFEH